MVRMRSCSVACAVFPDQGSNLESPALAGGFFITDHGATWEALPSDFLRKHLLTYFGVTKKSYPWNYLSVITLFMTTFGYSEAR